MLCSASPRLHPPLQPVTTPVALKIFFTHKTRKGIFQSANVPILIDHLSASPAAHGTQSWFVGDRLFLTSLLEIDAKMF
jgi:hypothetical protein